MNQQEFSVIIDSKYFTLTGMWSSSGRPSNRKNRAEGFTSAQISITHWLSGVIVIGKIENGHYSKTKMGKLKSELKDYLHQEMYSLLAKQLII